MLSALQAPQTPAAPTVPTYPVASRTPPQVNAPTVLSPPVPQYAAARGLGTWQQAIIIGGVIGIFVVLGLWVMQLLAHNSSQTNSNTSTTNSTPVSTQSETPITSQTTAPQPVPNVTQFIPTQPSIRRTQTPVTPSNSASISQGAAEQTIRNWLTAKREIFGPEHNGELGAQLLTGKAFGNKIRKTDNPDACLAQVINEDDCLSSVDWLIRNNAYYTYGVQKIEQIRYFSASGDYATIEVEVTEERSLYKNGRVDRENTNFGTSTTRYSLVHENGFVKISDYKTVN
jgi:serine/threonine-protein kinase